ncbi:MAG TPA: hypothetical protein VK856_14860 [Anaerolineaceae bacterium]|nr:hypothetical protein [Anaerolineaceae bacterium]
MFSKSIFIVADHGLAIVYFLQSDVVKTLLSKGIEIVFITDDALVDQIEKKFGEPGIKFEGLRINQAKKYSEQEKPTLQYWLHHLRRFGASKKINTAALDSQIPQVEFEAKGKRKLLLPIIRLILFLMRQSKIFRKYIFKKQLEFSPTIYSDLFEKYKPQLVVASSPGWRFDRYILREAKKYKIPTAAVVVGWDNPSSYSIPGAPIDWINCWSEVQKQELIDGSDWDPGQIFIGGIPTYDGYYKRSWLMSKDDYYKLHNLDKSRKLISYACSFVTFSPNIQNIKTLVDLIENDHLDFPAQLLIRLHPNHFLDDPHFKEEQEEIRSLAKENQFIHMVEPVPLGGELGYYSGEDMPEKTSMMAYSDVFTTVYSTMVVEAAIHNRPIISICIDVPGGWNDPNKYSLSLREIGEWPTHQRFRVAEAGQVVFDKESLKVALNIALSNIDFQVENRRKFIDQEITFTDAGSGVHVANFLISKIGKHYGKGE